MWGRKINVKESIFFQGSNIFDTLKKSLFGKIHNMLNTLVENNPKELEQYKLPTVIVIGNESTGKSSLLENVTKCQVFPRNSLIMTKAPIKLILKNGAPKYNVSYDNPDFIRNMSIIEKKDIYKIVQEILDALPNDSISEHEIIVEMTDYDLPEFEFIDLPGIRSYPPAMAETTVNLCKKYLSSPDSIVLCVVPATITRLTSCQSIALITEMGMESNCILALTMADRLQLENIEDLLIKRILLLSDEICGLKFKGCVAVVNRLHVDNYSLVENDDMEYKWFFDNILDCMPTDYVNYKQQITENVTISNLLCKMDELYNNFIHSDWKPRMINKINDDLTKIKNDIESLGPEEITLVDMNIMLEKFFNNNLSNIIPNINDEIKSKEDKEFSAIKNNYFGDCLITKLKLENEYKRLSESNYLLNEILKQIESFFSIENLECSAQKLNRFEDAKKNITSVVNKFYEENYKRELRKSFGSIIRILEQTFFNTREIIIDDFIKKLQLCADLIIYRFCKNLCFEGNNNFKENEEFSHRRQVLNRKLNILQNYNNSINNI